MLPLKSAVAFLLLSPALIFSQTVDCIEVMVQPEPMAIAKAKLKSTGKLPLGYWRITALNYCTPPATIAKQQIEMAVPAVIFLDAADAMPILLDRAGGKWRKIAHYGMLATMLAPGSFGSIKLSAHAVKIAGASLAAVEVIRHDIDSQTPDVTKMVVEIPQSILVPGATSPASPGGITLHAWAAKMKGAKTWGPVPLKR